MSGTPYYSDESVTLYHGDALDVLASLPNGSVDAVVTDHPYEIGGEVVRGNATRVEGLPAWDRHSVAWVAEAARVLKDGGSVVSFTDTRRPGELWDAYEAAGLRGRQVVYWVKHATPPNPRRSFQSAVEVAVWGSKGTVTEWSGGALTPNVWFGNIVKTDRLHPTQKPADLMAWLVKLVTAPDAVVLDPFCGSGTTGVACIALGRAFIGIERDAGYAAIARRRLADAAAQSVLDFGGAA